MTQRAGQSECRPCRWSLAAPHSYGKIHWRSTFISTSTSTHQLTGDRTSLTQSKSPDATALSSQSRQQPYHRRLKVPSFVRGNTPRSCTIAKQLSPTRVAEQHLGPKKKLKKKKLVGPAELVNRTTDRN